MATFSPLEGYQSSPTTRRGVARHGIPSSSLQLLQASQPLRRDLAPPSSGETPSFLPAWTHRVATRYHILYVSVALRWTLSSILSRIGESVLSLCTKRLSSPSQRTEPPSRHRQQDFKLAAGKELGIFEAREKRTLSNPSGSVRFGSSDTIQVQWENLTHILRWLRHNPLPNATHAPTIGPPSPERPKQHPLLRYS